MQNQTRFIKSKGENKMKKLIVALMVIAGLLSVNAQAFAANRTGSFRVGGYSSSGLGSHYYGGYNR